jgi:ATP-dependent helicase/nuclease subunit A
MTEAAAATDPTNSCSVLASAGTGKTWQLVARLTRLLLHGARLDSILAITFTRKAAGEMQQRLNERLRQLL